MTPNIFLAWQRLADEEAQLVLTHRELEECEQLECSPHEYRDFILSEELCRVSELIAEAHKAVSDLVDIAARRKAKATAALRLGPDHPGIDELADHHYLRHFDSYWK